MITTEEQITISRSRLDSLRRNIESAAAELANIRWAKEAQPSAASRVGATQAMIRRALTDLKRIVGRECGACEGCKTHPCRTCGGTGGETMVCSMCLGTGERTCPTCYGEGVVFDEEISR